MNIFWFRAPTQLFTQGQWWSIRLMQPRQTEQWWLRGALNEPPHGRRLHVRPMWSPCATRWLSGSGDAEAERALSDRAPATRNGDRGDEPRIGGHGLEVRPGRQEDEHGEDALVHHALYGGRKREVKIERRAESEIPIGPR
eukprot:SAG31_NODE_11709_length_1004_cov_2.230939_2_plen_141_part_00